ncbi:MAG: hypothetical protein EB127_08810 [Alphaproteobacteria bacterium]|nr:hypothetical protein [Alphaproteobacteria bacterium]
MRYTALLVLGVLIILCFFSLACSKDGFFDFHSDFVERQLTQFNDIGLSLIASNKLGMLGNSAEPVLKTSGPNAGEYAGVSRRFPLKTAEDGMWAKVKTCEAVTTDSCDAFNSSDFKSSDCGICLDPESKNSKKVTGMGGRFIEPSNLAAIRPPLVDYNPNNPNDTNLDIPNYQPTAGTCSRGYLVTTKAECLKKKVDLACQRTKAINSPDGCSQCLADGTYTIVDKTRPGVNATYGSIYVAGSGVLTVIQGTNTTTKTLGATSESIPIRVTEGQQITLSIEPQTGSTANISIKGYLADRTFFMDLYRTIQSDDQTGRKPLQLGGSATARSLDGKPVTIMGPGWGKNKMTLRMVVPFTFVNPVSIEGTRCPASPFVTTNESASAMGSDPCYTPGSGPGKYSLDCLKNTWESNGCTTNGKGYPNTASKATALMINSETGDARTLNDIADYIYNATVVSSTGVNVDGQQLEIPEWSATSMFCTGKEVVSPCVTATMASGPLSAECIKFLWRNKGSSLLPNGDVNPIGATYEEPTSPVHRSLFNTGIVQRGCVSSGSLSPENVDGTNNNTNIDFWRQKGGVNDVKLAMREIHNKANANGLDDTNRRVPFQQCYGNLTSFAEGFTSIPSFAPVLPTPCSGDSITKRSYTPRDSNLLNKSPIQLTQDYTLSFDITPNALVQSWGSILHFTTGEDSGTPGTRVPAIFFKPNSTSLYVRFDTISGRDGGFDGIPGCSLGTTTSVVIECKGLDVTLTVNGATNSLRQTEARYTGLVNVYGGRRATYCENANCLIENLCLVTKGNSIKVCVTDPALGRPCLANPWPGAANTKCGEYVTVFGKPNFVEFNFAIPVGQWNTIDEIHSIPGNNKYTIHGGDGNVSFIFPKGCPLKLTINDGPNFTGPRTYVITESSANPLTSGSATSKGPQFTYVPGWHYAQSIKCERM